jgi:hypothetical protein
MSREMGKVDGSARANEAFQCPTAVLEAESMDRSCHLPQFLRDRGCPIRPVTGSLSRGRTGTPCRTR